MGTSTTPDGPGPSMRRSHEPVPHVLSPLRAFVAGSAVVLAVTAVLVPFGPDLPRAVPALLLLAPVIGTGLLGGRLAAAAIALEAAIAFALGFLPPIGSPVVELTHDAVALVIFVVVAAALGTIISTVVTSERRRAIAERAQVETLTEIDAQRAALLRSVSHDLRTPLASIRAVVTDLQTDLPFGAETRTELLGLVASECERLDRLVANLLSMSRIEAGAFLPDRQPVDVTELIETSVGRLGNVLGDLDVEIDLGADLPEIAGDYTQLDQVVTNLVENAARHSPVGGRVVVAAATSAGGVRITVADEGPGIPGDARAEVLEPFRTGAGAASTGLGLAICRSVVEAHGGTIRIDDAPSGGARITVELPRDDRIGPGDR